MVDKMVSIDGTIYTYVIDTEFGEVKNVMLPEYINNPTSDIDTNVWNRGIFKVTYTLRLTDSEKWALDQILLSHATVKLIDDDYSIDDYVWMEELEAVYEANINWTYPWRVTVTFLVIRFSP